MNCPNCHSVLHTVEYEGVEIESCDFCGGEWLDAGELGKIVRLREVRFDPEERRAIAESTTITSVCLEAADRDMPCPKCEGTTDALQYGGDTHIIVHRCTACRGLWLDRGDLENVQKLIEGWDDALPDDLKKYGPKLCDIERQVDESDDVEVSQLPIGRRFINAAINGILDIVE